MSSSNRGISTLAMALALSVPVAGCGLIVGAGDYKVGAGANGGDAGPSSDDAATAVDAGNGGQPDGSEGADAGEADGGNSHADGPTGTDAPSLMTGKTVSCDGDGGRIDGPDVNSSDFQKLIDTCVQAVNCDPTLFAQNVSGCITNNYLQAIGSVACLSTIADCNGFYSCKGKRGATPTECQGRGVTGFCGGSTGNVATTCIGDAFVGSVQNCDQLAGPQTCATYLDPKTNNTVADCVVNPTCSDTDGKNHCFGNKLYSCVNGIGYGMDCGSTSTCQDMGATEGALCYFNANSTACATPGLSCKGDVLASCNTGTPNQEFDYQCSRAGLSCAASSSDVACLAPGCAPPSTSTCVESCAADGITAEVCIGGAPFAIDCTKHGFKKCTFDSADSYAFCVY